MIFTTNLRPNKENMQNTIKAVGIHSDRFIIKQRYYIMKNIKMKKGAKSFNQKVGGIMASSKEYLKFVLEQLSGLEEITYRAMIGEYIIAGKL